MARLSTDFFVCLNSDKTAPKSASMLRLLVGAFSAIGPVRCIDPYPQPPNVSGPGHPTIFQTGYSKISRRLAPRSRMKDGNQSFLRPAINTVAPMIAAGSPSEPDFCKRMAHPSFLVLPSALPGSFSVIFCPFHMPTDCTS